MRFIACLIAVGGALTGSGSRTLVAQQPIAADWPQFRGNPQLTGVASSTLPPALKVMWTFDAGDAIESSAAIADGTVYVGSAAGELVALDLQTGAVRWKYRTAEIGESSPAIANGVVYIGDLTGTFHAVDAKSGKPLWTFKTTGKSDPRRLSSATVCSSDHATASSARCLRRKVLSSGRSNSRATFTRRRRWPMAWPTFPDVTRPSVASASTMDARS